KDQKTQSNVNSTNLASDCFINCDYDDDLYIMEISPTEKACLSMLSQDTDELPSEDEAIATFSNKNDY
ncbi:15963_t:CDS:1, partial [Racocetra fulgida]